MKVLGEESVELEDLDMQAKVGDSAWQMLSHPSACIARVDLRQTFS